MWHLQTIFLGLPVQNSVLLFAWIKAKVYWRHWMAVNLVRWDTWLLPTTASDIFQNIPTGGDVGNDKQLGILKVVSLFGQCSHQVPIYSLLRSCFKITSDRAKWSYYVHSHLSGTQVWTQHYYVLVAWANFEIKNLLNSSTVPSSHAS